jgi:Methyltransferase domain
MMADTEQLEQAIAELARMAGQGDVREEAARQIGSLLWTYIKSGAYPTLFRLWEAGGLHVTPVHYYSPIPDTRELPSALWGRRSTLPGLDLNDAGQTELLRAFVAFRREYDALPLRPQADPGEFFFGNPMFSGTDALVLYCMVRYFRPSGIIEIGSGFSSRVIRRATRANGGARVTCIDPFPADGLGNWFPEATIISEPVQKVELPLFHTLRAGDILFIDSSHVARIGGDVTFLFLEVLPRLNPGVLVHVHDIFLPFEMRQEWVQNEMRFWTEQYLLQAFLTFNREFEILMANSYLAATHAELLRATFSKSPWWGGGSFWMRRVPSTSQVDSATSRFHRDIA